MLIESTFVLTETISWKYFIWFIQKNKLTAKTYVYTAHKRMINTASNPLVPGVSYMLHSSFLVP